MIAVGQGQELGDFRCQAGRGPLDGSSAVSPPLGTSKKILVGIGTHPQVAQ